jgi:isopentenyl-diphosphate delta-isomerase
VSQPREAHLVELVDETGRPVGQSTVEAAHQLPGQLHRAFSVLLTDPQGRLLLQRRAAAKTRFPLRWANSCCGHPLPGEPLAAAANRRIGEELGVDPVELTELGIHLYRAEDPATGRVEHEYDHVLLGRIPAGLPTRPDPAEVVELHWVDPAELAADLVDHPDRYAPWLGGVLDQLTRSTPVPGYPDPDQVGVVDAAERSGGR